MNAFRYILNRLKERSTWMGLIGLATAFGLTLSPEQTEAIIAFGISLVGLIAIFTKDADSPDNKKIVKITKEEGK